jgi:protein O-mannosyl-transferase
VTIFPSAAAPAGRAARADRWRVLLLVLAAAVPYLATLGFGYIYDDTTIVRSNARIRGWLSLVTLWKQSYEVSGGVAHGGLYRPLFMALLAAIWNTLGHVPFWFHLVAVALHVAVTVIVWYMLRRAVGQTAAMLGAAWFAVQPVHVEAVANIANSSEVLVAVWTGLLALFLQKEMRTHAGTVSWRGAIAAAVLYGAACLTKESGFTAAPFALIWVWGWRTPTDGRQSLRQVWRSAARLWRLWLSFAATVTAVVIARVLVLGSLISRGSIAAPGLDTMSASARVTGMLALGPRIGMLLLWPATINPHYGPSTLVSHPAPRAVATIAAIVAAGWAAVVLARRGDRRFLAALACAVIAFLPASNLFTPTGQILAERTLYVASIGAVMILALTVDTLRRRSRAFVIRSRPLIEALPLLVAVLIPVQGVRTFRFAWVWGDHERLFKQMIAADPAGYRGYWLLGMAERYQSHPDSAAIFLQHAYTAFPHDRQLLVDYTETLLRIDRDTLAASVASQLMTWPELRRDPHAVALYLNAMGAAYGPDSVIAAGSRLSARSPSATASLFVGAAYDAIGRRATALETYHAGLRLAPGDSALSARLRAPSAAGQGKR